MMQVVHVKLNPRMPWQNKHSAGRRNSFLQQIGLKFKEETIKLLHLEHSLLRCWDWDTSESRSEVLWKFWNVVLKKRWRRLFGQIV